MKKQIVVALLGLAVIGSAQAADKVFQAPELSLEVFGVGNMGQDPSAGALIAEDTFGAGIGGSFFFLEKWGNQVGANVSLWSTDWTGVSGSFFDDGRLLLEVRRPVLNSGVAIGAFIGVGYTFENDDRYETFGGKLSFRTSENWEFWTRIGYKTDSISGGLGANRSFDGHGFGEVGFSIIPRFWQSSGK